MWAIKPSQKPLSDKIILTKTEYFNQVFFMTIKNSPPSEGKVKKLPFGSFLINVNRIQRPIQVAFELDMERLQIQEHE